MRAYNVLVNPDGQYAAVPVGWSWPAFCFNIIWASYKKLWKYVALFGVAFLGMLALPFTSGELSEFEKITVPAVVAMMLSVVLGLTGNRFFERSLLAVGFEYQATVVARHASEAIQRRPLSVEQTI